MLKRLVDFLHRVEEGILVFLLAGMVIVTFSQVVARYVFNTGAIWALELTSFMFAWLVVLGVSYGIRIHSHIGIDAFVKLFGEPVQRALGLLAIGAGLVYAVLLLIGSLEHTFGVVFEYGFETEDLKIPMWIPFSVLVFGFSMMIFRLLLMAVRIVVYKEYVTMIADESKEALDQFSDDEGEGAG